MHQAHRKASQSLASQKQPKTEAVKNGVESNGYRKKTQKQKDGVALTWAQHKKNLKRKQQEKAEASQTIEAGELPRHQNKASEQEGQGLWTATSKTVRSSSQPAGGDFMEGRVVDEKAIHKEHEGKFLLTVVRV